MSDRQTHIIHRLNIEVNVCSARVGYALHEEMLEYIRADIIPRLERLFDEMASPEESLRLEQLDVMLDGLATENWSLTLPDRVVAETGRQMQALPIREDNVPDRKTGRLDVLGSTVDPVQWLENRPVRQPRDHGRLAVFLYYLQRGYLPWWSGPDIRPDLEGELRKAIEEAPPSFWGSFRPLLSSPLGLHRLIFQFSDVIQDQLLATGWSAPIQSLKTYFLTVKALLRVPLPAGTRKPPLPTARALRNDYYQTLWREVRGAERDALSSGQLEAVILDWGAGVWLRALRDVPSELVREWLMDLASSENGVDIRSAAADNPVVEAMIRRAVRRMEGTGSSGRSIPDTRDKNGQAAGPPHQTGNRDGSADEQDLVSISDQGNTANDLPVDKDYGTRPESVFPYERPEGYYVENAGLVLLHSFLPTCFEACGFCREGAFVDAAAQVRAIHLLHYLATGKTQPPEHELVLNKFLCHWPLEAPLERRVRLSPRMKKEADHLLEVVLQYWEVMSNSEPDALRGNFLLREGKLFEERDTWRLIVEPQTHDILLNRLPWGFGVVKFPWMPKVLLVEWMY